MTAGIVALIPSVATFAGLADILGAVFLLIAVLWMVQAFMQRAFNEFWWMGLISGILMVGSAFSVSGQYFMTRAAMLLVFAGIWAAMKGVTDIVRAFAIRCLVGSPVGQTRRPKPSHREPLRQYRDSQPLRPRARCFALWLSTDGGGSVLRRSTQTLGPNVGA